MAVDKSIGQQSRLDPYSMITRWLLIIFLSVGIFCFYFFHLHEYLNYATLKKYHSILLAWTEQHYLKTVLLYSAIYIITVAMSIPGSVYITLAGGLIFGPIATLYVVLSATIGAALIFLLVKTTFYEWFAKITAKWVKKMEQGFQKNAFNYLLILRQLPIFPFWVVNIVAALLGVRLRTFFFATMIGIIPGSFFYVMIGNSLSEIFKKNQTPSFNIIFDPAILLPLIAIALFVIVLLIYKKLKTGVKS